MSEGIPDSLVHYIMGEQRRDTIPTALAEAVKIESKDVALEAAGDKTRDYLESLLSTESPTPLALDFKRRNGLFLLMPSLDADVRNSDAPRAIHLVAAYGADTEQTGLYGRDFHNLVTEPAANHPLHTSLEEYTARRLGWQVSPESGQGSDFLSLGPIQEHMRTSEYKENEDWLMRNADPYSIALLLTASPSEVVEAAPGSLAAARRELVQAMDVYKQNNLASFNTFWEGISLIAASLPRIDYKHPVQPIQSYSDYRARILAS